MVYPLGCFSGYSKTPKKRFIKLSRKCFRDEYAVFFFSFSCSPQFDAKMIFELFVVVVLKTCSVLGYQKEIRYSKMMIMM